MLPEARLTVTFGAGSLLSVALTVKYTTEPKYTAASVVMPEGHVITGAVVSLPCGADFGGPPFASAGDRPAAAPSATSAITAIDLDIEVAYLMGFSLLLHRL